MFTISFKPQNVGNYNAQVELSMVQNHYQIFLEVSGQAREIQEKA